MAAPYQYILILLSVSLPPALHFLCVQAHQAIPRLLFIFHVQLLKLQAWDNILAHSNAKGKKEQFQEGLLWTELFHGSIFS